MFKQVFNTIVRGGGKDASSPSMDKMLEQTDSHLFKFDELIQPAEESRPRTPFDAHLPKEQVSMANLEPRQRLQVMTKVVPLFTNMQVAARMYDGKPQPEESEASAEFLADLEALAHEAGVADIGYVKVPNYAIFRDKGIPAPYAIVFTVEMEKEPIDTAPSFECQLEVMDGYKRMASISRKLARFMRKHGHAAYPGMALGGVTDYPHLAELAGLGAIGYHGLLIAPGEGARLRINTIYTNISNLPTLEARGAKNEHLWVRDFCALCHKCVRKCPADAIFQEPQPRGDGGMQTIDHAACRTYFTSNYGCGVCLAVCPFSQVGYEKVQARFKGNPDAHQFRIPINSIA